MKIIIIFLLIVIVSCSQSKVQKAHHFYYPNESSFDTKNLSTIDLDFVINYEDFLHKMDSLMCGGKKINIVLDEEKCIYNLQPHYRCLMDDGPPFPYKMRSILRIKGDSIIRRTEECDFSLLPGFMLNFYNNKYNGDFPEDPDKGILLISFKNETGNAKMKSNLKKVFESFNRINSINGDSLHLNILFVEDLNGYYRSIIPPQL